jgi:hypothetical protein
LLEQWKINILDDKEVAWRLKSRALWLEKGDHENTKYFHHDAMHRKNVNTI